MKNVTVIIRKEDIKSTLLFNKIIVGIFILIILFYVFIGSEAVNFFAPTLGLIISLLSFYANNKNMKIKGNVLSKTTMDISIIKRGILADKIAFTIFLIVLGFISLVSLIADFEYFIGFLPFAVFVLFGIYRRFKILSKNIKGRKY
jgi:hypothetical protein